MEGQWRCWAGALHGEDRSAAADVKNDLVLKKVLVLNNGIHV